MNAFSSVVSSGNSVRMRPSISRGRFTLDKEIKTFQIQYDGTMNKQETR
jgi:hypothetical protein